MAPEKGYAGMSILDIDQAVDAEARSRELTVQVFPAWYELGDRAPLLRNSYVVGAGRLVAWPAPWSRGTWDAVRRAEAAGITVDLRAVA